jgi:hypothetical protein
MKIIIQKILKKLHIHNWVRSEKGWSCTKCGESDDGIRLTDEDGYFGYSW